MYRVLAGGSDMSEDARNAQLKRLWCAGLSATLTLHLSGSDLLVKSLNASEDYGTAEELRDEFPIWAKKVTMFLEPHKKGTLAEHEKLLHLGFTSAWLSKYQAGQTSPECFQVL